MTRVKKMAYAVLASIAVVLSMVAPITSSPALAKPVSSDPTHKTIVPGQFAGVVRDITAEADCHQAINGVNIPCRAGSVVGSTIIPRSEVRKGERYIVYSGNMAKDNAAMQHLMAEIGPQFAANAKVPNAVTPALACGVTASASGSYTATIFDGITKPRIGYSLHFYLGYQNGVCNRVYITDSETHLISAGTSATYLEATSFNSRPGDLSGGWYPGCASLPHTSPYPAPNYLSGNSGYAFTDQVQSDCNWFIHRAYGYITLP